MLDGRCTHRKGTGFFMRATERKGKEGEPQVPFLILASYAKAARSFKLS
ncbi:MAG: hypothetical protein GTO13_08600 [Proteobacteria bacterium]|nr:hypothetical protein [Pseudomonadota bacterium]